MCYLNDFIYEKRGRWRGAVRDLKHGMEECELIK